MKQVDCERGRGAWIALLCAFIVLVMPVILLGSDNTSEAHDQNRHHLVVIRQATASITGAGDAPALGSFVKDYPSATSPGYHIVLALFDACGSGSTTALRLISSLFGLALVLSLWKILARRVDGWLAVSLTLPLLCSAYFLSGCMWLTTDVAAVWFIVLALGSLLTVERSQVQLARAGFFAALAVLVRQPTIWLIAPVYLSAWFARKCKPVSPVRRVATICALALPLLVIGWLIVLWGGIMPPAYRSIHDTGPNGATVAFALSLLGVWGLPWAIALCGRQCAELRQHWMGCSLLLVMAIVALALQETSYDQAAGRWGGPLWSAVQIAPVVMNRSLLLIALAVVGIAVMVVIVRAAKCASAAGSPDRGWIIFAIACVAIISALTVNSQCWERYVDLPLLALLPLGVVLGVDRSNQAQRRRLIIASTLLAIVQLGLSLWMVYRPTFLEAPLS